MHLAGLRDVAVSIYGAWRFLHFDRSAVQFFDNTADAFWKSFTAAIVAAPGYALLILLRLVDREVAAGELRILLVEVIAYVIAWTAFPVIMITVADKLGRAQWYFRFIAAWNWSIIIQVVIMVMVAAFANGGILPQGLAGIVSLAAVVLILFYQGFIARVMLDVNPGIAAMIVGIDLLISLFLDDLSMRML